MKTNHTLRALFRSITLALAAACALGLAPAALAQAKSGDRYSDLIIEYLALEPQVAVNEIGDGPRRPEGDEARLTAFLFNLRDTEVYAAIDWAGAAERQEIGYIQPGESKAVSISIAPADIPYDQPIIAQVYNMEAHKLEETDRATLHGEKAMRIALLVERRTWDAGNKKFGSFTRHMRESLEGLHDLFASTSAPEEAGLERQAITDRFRIERVELFDRPADSTDTQTRPAIFDSHPNYDVVVACDEDGPFTGYWPEQYSIGWNLSAPGGESGLTSDAAEAELWKSLLQFRGVQDYAAYRIEAGALPGRWSEAIDVPEPFAGDLMNRPGPSPRIGALAAAVANSKAGVSRLSPCDDPKQTHGHVWRWVPRNVKLRIIDSDDQPVAGLKVLFFRSLPISEGANAQGVAADRPPNGTTETDANGEAVIRGDFLGARSAPDLRSRWLLVETLDGAGMRRFAVLSGLWLNAAYAAGSKDEALWTVRLEEMHQIK